MRKSAKIYFTLSLVSLIVFLFILFNLNSFSGLDNSINSFFRTNQNTILINLSMIIHYVFDPIYSVLIVLFISLFIWIKNMRKDAAVFAFTAAIAGVLIEMFKLIVKRARPETTLEYNFSFPSGHATISVVLFGILIYLCLKSIKNDSAKIFVSVILTLVMLFIGFSRILLSVHWFSDVLGGFFLGCFLFFLALFVRKNI